MDLLRLVASLLLAIATTIAPAQAQQVSTTTHLEIEALFKQLKASGCQFNRNDTWYSGADAQSHLTKKLKYFENKNMIKNTEDFITHAASVSSSSGKAYQVKCGNDPATESKVWLLEQLKSLRASK